MSISSHPARLVWSSALRCIRSMLSHAASFGCFSHLSRWLCHSPAALLLAPLPNHVADDQPHEHRQHTPIENVALWLGSVLRLGCISSSSLWRNRQQCP